MRQKVLSVLLVSVSVVITKSSQYVQGYFNFFKYCAVRTFNSHLIWCLLITQWHNSNSMHLQEKGRKVILIILVVDAKLFQNLFIYIIYTQLLDQIYRDGLFLDGSFLHDHISLRSEENGRTGSRWQMNIEEHAACPAWRQMGCSSRGPQLRLRRVSSSLLNPSHEGWWQLLRQQNSCVQLMKWALGVYCSSVARCAIWHLGRINKGIKSQKSTFGNFNEILPEFCICSYFITALFCAIL